MEINQNVPKFDLKKGEEDLKLYFFTIQFGQISLDIREDFQATFAYNKESAIQEVRKSYQDGIPIIIKDRASVDVKKVIDVINQAPVQKLELQIPPSVPKEKKIEDFIQGLMLLSDEYITKKADKSLLKEIIKRIKIK